MSGGVRLDLDPKNGTTKKYDIERTENSTDGKVPEGYKSYKYAKQDSGSFILSAFLFKGNLLPGVLLYPISVTSVITYFKESKYGRLLLVDIAVSDGKHVYYLNPDTTARGVTFTEFAPTKKTSLETGELDHVLQNINTNNGFDIGKLITNYSTTAKKLFGDTDIIFDLSKTNDKYDSEVTTQSVSVIDYGIKVASTYPKVDHTPASQPFYAKGIKLPNGKYMKVKGGFPNEGFTGFNVYYKEDNKNVPLLIELKLKVLATDAGNSYIPGWYYIYKTDNANTWDIIKVTGTSIDNELPELLKKISTENNLEVEKLLPGVKDLEIDLTQTTNSNTGETKHYASGKTTVHYKQVSFNEYKAIRHASAFPSFTVNSIKTGSGGDITKGQLPPPGTLLSKLNAYYNDSSHSQLVLIELIGFHDPSLTNYPKYVYYYYNDGTKWVDYLLSTTVSSHAADMENVIKHVRANSGKIAPEKLGELKSKLTKYTPDKIEIESSKSGLTDITFDLSYKPKGNDGRSQATYQSGNTGIKVSSATNSSIPQYPRVKHDLSSSGAKSFTVGGIQLHDGQDMEVNGGLPKESMTNFFVYYSRENYEKYDDPLLITLTISNENADDSSYTSDRYLLVKSKDATKWDVYLARKFEENDENPDLTTILKNASDNGFNFDELDQEVKKKLIKYPLSRSRKSTLRQVLEGCGETGAAGGVGAEAYNFFFNPNKSATRQIIRLLTTLF
ncbi:hypothetical protein BEWA_022980 [Theileria equi strain WA]|uniref:Uncharacterized protein n=1 Tax=Theileria equi strain WA TaxID=1537102 RepID=L0AV86_THEEQ|nr:hypothetical protein BEWA_022980 [Theileria equi strain WA]AFZ79450.1 hypothetical protein BEWA_022980 [Theileria equi strain WA]|eukprot:XP_004829116.1 hypothetical protein BEWA_022980 [Theileria equi strain WA]